MRLTPRMMKFGVVVFGIIDNDDHAAPALVRPALEQLQESPDRQGIKTVGLAREEEFAVPQAHRAEIAHALAGGMVQQHGVFDFGRYPHAAARAVLLEAHLIHGPELDGGIFGQGVKFFCVRPAGPDRPARSPGAAFGNESPTGEGAAGIGVPPVPPRAFGAGKPPWFCPPRGCRLSPRRWG